MPTNEPQSLQAELSQYGIPPTALHPLTAQASPELIEYLDIIEPPDGSAIATSLRPDSVAEVQGRPLLFIVNESKLATTDSQRAEQISKSYDQKLWMTTRQQKRRTLGD